MDGIIPLWKPKGLTSHDCVFKIRKLLKTKKVGHTGTLDPDVDGVLPICIGKATKVVEYLTDAPKAYQGEVTIGVSTTTEDASGETVEEKEIDGVILIDELLNVLQTFTGDIKQIPPMYSAVKINGKRLYEYARQGQIIDRPERHVHIYELKLLDHPEVLDKSHNTFRFYVKCSKGTYVRTLAVDIGKQLGYPAHMSQLTRVAAGSFSTDDCLTFEDIEKHIERGDLQLLPLERGISDLTKFEINEKLELQVKNGQVLPIPEKLKNMNRLALYNVKSECVAIYTPHPTKIGFMKPEKVLRND
ncbi:tRNA pseudouridine(55) synthase TruB [Bacillus sp. Marseille-P3661]|uniref:tRNA pseudouridine(55) synthase TruB n=1 Tax=Bacillus sp. Marseille-P3661 TaxID=1936234 RepID=UPI000C8390DF|nr:tRNA pseudouridine(55) synthase TruB [Bacillus sp. Marseille-P3661]